MRSGTDAGINLKTGLPIKRDHFHWNAMMTRRGLRWRTRIYSLYQKKRRWRIWVKRHLLMFVMINWALSAKNWDSRIQTETQNDTGNDWRLTNISTISWLRRFNRETQTKTIIQRYKIWYLHEKNITDNVDVVKEKNYWWATFQIWSGQAQIERIHQVKQELANHITYFTRGDEDRLHDGVDEWHRKKYQKRSTNLNDIEEESSVHVVIRQSVWEEVTIYQEVRSDKQLVSHNIKWKDISVRKDSLEYTTTIVTTSSWTSVQIVARTFRRRDLIVGCHIQGENESICSRLCATTEQYEVTTEFNW